jgi:hypothetical protein
MMASVKLDMVNIVDEIHENFSAGIAQDQAFADYLHNLTAGLNITFDVDHLDNTHEGIVLEFTGKPSDLVYLIRRYEEDVDLRAEHVARIKYVDPMPGSCQS